MKPVPPIAPLPSSPRRTAKIADDHIYRALVESVRDYAIFVLDPQGNVATWNPGAERLKYYRPDEIIGKHFSVFYPEKDIRDGKPKMELEVAAATGRFEDEGWRLRKDGSRFWANVVITALRDERGELMGFGKITRDLTERRVAELRYKMLIDSVTDYAIYSLDPTGVISSWNPGIERIKGYTADEVVGRHFSMFYTPEDAKAGLPQHVLRTAREEGHFEGEGWRQRKDGTRFWSSVVVTPLYDEEGRLTGFSKVTRDITDRKILMDELQAHTRELEIQVAERERTNAELEAFSYSVSHDLRAPLRAIEGFANALQEDYGQQFDATANDYLNEIKSASTRMSRLVQDLLEYGRLSRADLLTHPTHIAPLVAQAAEQVVAGAGPKVEGDRDACVVAHEITLVQVLSNLLSNAYKFQSKGNQPKVTVRISPGELPDSVRISVRDNGIGIAEQHRERIFKVFERLHGVEEYPGTGIGLAIVKRGVERMGGRVGMESRLGDGSEFWVELPAADANECAQ